MAKIVRWVKVGSPGFHNDGRRYITVRYEVVKRKPYARFLMEQELGRELRANEEVHHIDGDKTNDLIENLQVLDKKEHARITADSFGVTMYDFNCASCSKLSSIPLSQYKRHRDSGPYCSISCANRSRNEGDVTLTCPHCNDRFTITVKQYNRSSGRNFGGIVYCSQSCGTKAYWKRYNEA